MYLPHSFNDFLKSNGISYLGDERICPISAKYRGLCPWSKAELAPTKFWLKVLFLSFQNKIGSTILKLRLLYKIFMQPPPPPPFNQWFGDSFSCHNLNSVYSIWKLTFQMVSSNIWEIYWHGLCIAHGRPRVNNGPNKILVFKHIIWKVSFHNYSIAFRIPLTTCHLLLVGTDQQLSQQNPTIGSK